MRLFVLVAASLRGVVLPFPDVEEASSDAQEVPEAPVASAAPAAPAPASDDAVAPWTPPTVAPDPFATSADAYKHPSSAVVKDWETAPKVEIFDIAQPATEQPKKEVKKEAALPVVKSQLQPILTTRRDDDPELAAIQQENPMAYGIVKALLLKKSMGLPLPGAQAVQRQATDALDGVQHAPASSQTIGNMWNWKPNDSASDGADAELAAVEQGEEVSKAPAPVEAEPAVAETIVAEPQRTESAAPEPAAPEPAAPEPEAPEPEAPAPAAAEKPKAALVGAGSSLSDFLGTGLPDSLAAPRSEAPAPKKEESYSANMAAYMKDLA